MSLRSRRRGRRSTRALARTAKPIRKAAVAKSKPLRKAKAVKAGTKLVRRRQGLARGIAGTLGGAGVAALGWRLLRDRNSDPAWLDLDAPNESAPGHEIPTPPDDVATPEPETPVELADAPNESAPGHHPEGDGAVTAEASTQS